MAAERKRLDALLYDRALFSSRSAARAAIMAGLVLVEGRKADKPGMQVKIDAVVEVTAQQRYVSRGGLKLEGALQAFNVNISGRIAMDVGASTGGFTDCLLQNGVQKVYCVDVGYGQLDWGLRQNLRVVALERTNIRYLNKEDIDEEISLAVVDVSFISLSLVLPTLARLAIPEAVVLVKPQFEAGKGKVGKKGVVRDRGEHVNVLVKVAQSAVKEGFNVTEATFSPLQGPEGNIEYFLHLVKKHEPLILPDNDFINIVNEAHDYFAGKRL